jgi:hypothetical protein
VIARTALANWDSRPLCDDPALRWENVHNNLTFAIHTGQLQYYAKELLKSFSPPEFLYFMSFQLRRFPGDNIFPGAPSTIALPVSALTVVAFAVFVACGAVAFLIGAVKTFKTRRRVVPVVAVGSIWLIYLCSMVARIGYPKRPIYEAGLIEPLLAMVSVASIWLARERLGSLLGPNRLARAARLGFALLIGLSVINQIGLMASYIPYATSTWTHPGYVKDQELSITSFGYDKIRDSVLQTAALCGIDPTTHPRRLVVDELTYFPLRQTFGPFFGSYIDEHTWGKGITNIRNLLAKWQSGGMVVGCQWIPSALRSEAVENGAFCCVPSFKGTD